jgi:hypothetical protein
MLTHPTIDKLMALRLPAFAEACQRQLGNPEFSALSFEDDLAPESRAPLDIHRGAALAVEEDTCVPSPCGPRLRAAHDWMKVTAQVPEDEEHP